MMKFATNHPNEFTMPKLAFMIGLMQFLGGFFCELACITFLSTLDKTIEVIIKFIALGSIAKIDDFYAAALPPENKVKKNAKKGEEAICVSQHRRNIVRSEHTCGVRFLHVVTKLIRILYCSFIFYFFPFLVLFLPNLAGG